MSLFHEGHASFLKPRTTSHGYFSVPYPSRFTIISPPKIAGHWRSTDSARSSFKTKLGSSQVERVAVIGAGPSGLAAMRIFSQNPRIKEIVTFESTLHVGGVWNQGDTGPMYNNLRTNIPKEIMKFPDEPFCSDIKTSYLSHKDVLIYLNCYAEKYNLLKYIKFGCSVKMVRPIDPNDPLTGWKLTYSCGDRAYTTKFDAVVVCNGHLSTPYIPDIPGRKFFKGQCLHSVKYREPSVFSGKIVLVLGSGASGTDIAVELTTVCTKVLFSHNQRPMECYLPGNLQQVVGIHHFSGDYEVCLLDGSKHYVDVVVLCTGYQYHLDFLSRTCCPLFKEDHLEPIFQHILHAKLPRLGFIGLCSNHIPFPIFYMQARAISTLMTDDTPLTTKEMLADVANLRISLFKRNIPLSRWHVLGRTQWTYLRRLASLARCQPLPHYLELVFNQIEVDWNSGFTQFRENKFEVDEERGTYTVIRPE